MVTDIIIPKLGAEMQGATIDEWVVNEGSWTNEGEIILVIQTEKITNEIEASVSGYLYQIGQEGTTYDIGMLIGQIAETKEQYEQLRNLSNSESSQSIKQNESKEVSIINEDAKAEEKKLWFKASPLARKIAKDHSINLSDVLGSGSAGAILKRDILAYVERNKHNKQVAPEVQNQQIPLHVEKKIKTTQPLKGMRKAIADAMMKSLSSTAQMTDINEIEIGKLVEFRNSINEELQDELGFKITYNDLFIKIVATVLKKIPILNASIINDEIVQWESINIGMAVALENGLIVPVIKDADKLSLSEIHVQSTILIEKARTSKLTSDDITNGTFTITNYGSFGGFLGTPILNVPEVAILGIGAITQKPVVRDGEIVIGEVFGYSLTVDHRLIDGKIAGDFQRELKRIINNPTLLFV